MDGVLAVVFDMDGVLVDSERFWQDAEIDVLGRLGVPLTRDMCRQTMGFRVDEAVAHWYTRYPWHGPSPAEVEQDVMAAVVHLIRTSGQPMPGVAAAIDYLTAEGVPLAVASSSFYAVIDAVLEVLGIADRFEVVHSAQDERLGKPHPDVYLTAARKLGVDPTRCVAVEDSVNGLRSAKAAGMTCVAIPDPGLDPAHFVDADAVLDSLTDLPTWFAGR
jgi:mannitol-1-/sugar-/sorbitol-6-/2-deoxyglucose-6-phosphatase